jgi:hypothetical protein
MLPFQDFEVHTPWTNRVDPSRRGGSLEICGPPYYPPAYPDELYMYLTRLEILGKIGKRYQLYAYPKPRPSKSIIQPQTQIPALVSYTLAPNFTWREGGNERRSLTVPQIDWTNKNEIAVALRTLRAGGALMNSSYYDEWLERPAFCDWRYAE